MKKNIIFIAFICISQLLIAQKNRFEVVYTVNLKPSVVVKDWEINKCDTIVCFVEKSKLYSYQFNASYTELAIINSIPEVDMISYWYHLFVKDMITGKWQLVADGGIGGNVYRMGIKSFDYKFIDTRNIDKIDVNKNTVGQIKVNDSFNIRFEPKRN